MEDKYLVLDPQDQLYLEMLEDLNTPQGDAELIDLNSRLHEKQIECLKSLYIDNKNLIVVNCGRKFGKSELAAYALWRHALFNPGSACYYIAPEASHGRKILWDTRRLQKFLGKASSKYIDGQPNNLEMKIRFKNGSFIQIFGSENWAAANGLSPSIVVYDEFKAFNPQFHVEMDPNRTAKGASLIIIGTMPKVGDRNKEQYEALLEYAQTHTKNAAVHTYTTFDNPINMLPERKPAIDEQIAILRARGEEDVVQREYYSRIVAGGSRAIFPMLEQRHIKPHFEMIDEISRDRKKLDWYLIADPGTTTCFAALFVAMHPYTKHVYILDEIYEKDQQYTSTRKIFPHMEAKMKDLFPHGDIYYDWFKTADEAASWFMNEVLDQYGIYFQKTDKVHNKKEQGLSLIKDQLIYNLVSISDRCTNLVKEMREYAKDNNGNIPKKNDHLVDCLRYCNAAMHYSMKEVVEGVKQKSDYEEIRTGRFKTYDDDYISEDWMDKIVQY